MTISIRARHRIIRSISLLVMALHPRYEHYPWSPDWFSRQPMQSCFISWIKMLDFVHFLEIKHLFKIIIAPSPAKLTLFTSWLSAVGGRLGTIQTRVTRTHCTPGLTLDSGLDAVFTVHLPMAVLHWTWICTSGAGTTLDVARIGLSWH